MKLLPKRATSPEEKQLADRYKFEEVRFVTVERDTLKMWTYEFKENDLYLDCKVQFAAPIISLAVSPYMGNLVVIDETKTVKFYSAVDGKGTMLQEIKFCPYTHVSCLSTEEEKHLWLFGTETGQLVTYDIKKRSEITVFKYPKKLQVYDEQTDFNEVPELEQQQSSGIKQRKAESSSRRVCDLQTNQIGLVAASLSSLERRSLQKKFLLNIYDGSIIHVDF